MSSNLIKILKNSQIFANAELGDNVFEALAEQFHTVHLNEDDILFREGEASRYLFILIQGKLTVYLSTATSKIKSIGTISPGETVGELGALSNDLRTFSAKASEPSRLIKLSTLTFKRLCKQYPKILLSTAQPILNRTQSIIRLLSSNEQKKHIAIIPANSGIETDIFLRKMREVIAPFKKIVLLNAKDFENSKDPVYQQIEDALQTAKQKNHHLIFMLTCDETKLSKMCWDKIGKIYVMAENDKQPEFCPFVIDKLNEARLLVEVRRELILCHSEKSDINHGVHWRACHPFFMHHNVRKTNHYDYERLLRFMRGKANGLVLSGGGVKGWAHLGVLKALIEQRIPIDAIGGTSVGAMVAALYAMDKTYETMHQHFTDLIIATHHTVSLRKICWPAVSLFNCEEFTLALEKIFHTHKIEELWIPYFCVTTNLAHYKENIHTEGYLWEKIRGSTSIPGVVPPMIMKGELHIDGGLVNNLPVNTMRELLGPEGNIIAAELVTTHQDLTQYSFPPTLTLKQAFLAKFGLGYRSYHFPKLIDTFLKSLLVGASLKQQENAQLADLLISLQTDEYGMLTLKKDEDTKLFQLGYNATIEKTADWKKIKSQ